MAANTGCTTLNPVYMSTWANPECNALIFNLIQLLLPQMYCHFIEPRV